MSFLLRRILTEVQAIRLHVMDLEQRIMTGQDDLAASLARIEASVTALGTALDALIAAHNSGNDTAFEAAATRAKAVADALDADTTKAQTAATAV